MEVRRRINEESQSKIFKLLSSLKIIYIYDFYYN